MKKIALLLLMLFASMLQARFYIGIENGYTAQGIPALQTKGKGIEFHTILTSTLKDILKNGATGYNISLVLGSESFYGRYFGLRWGLGAGYSSTEIEFKENGKKYELELQGILADMNVDMIINIVNTGSFALGFFGGAGINYEFFTSSGNPKLHALGFNGRAGVTTLLANHHRVELFAKIPFMDLSSKFIPSDKNAFVSGAQQISFLASYKFVF